MNIENGVTFLCCMCGMEIQHNPANMCITCVREHIDITEGINRQLTIHSCRGCGRFLSPPWQDMKLESKELMAVCLRKVNGLNKVKLVDAVWIWTEPHSRRLKIKITIQKEVMNGAVLQQAALLEFTIRNQQCNLCQASFATGTWQAIVAVRQRVPHKRTFFFLEQLLLKHNAHSDCTNIITFRDGMDFYFTEKQYAMRFQDFLQSHVPTRTKYARKLVSADHKSNIGKFKHNFIVEIVPLCKDDLIIMPKPLANNLSDFSRLALVKTVSAGIHIVDPFTGERQEIDTEKYWRYEFDATMTSRSLVKYIVLAVEPILVQPRASSKKRGLDRKVRMAEITIVRERDFGVSDEQFRCVSHLGHILRDGDTVLGYDLASAAWTHEEGADDALRGAIPDVILVRKVYASKGDRIWELRSLEVDDSARELNTRDQEAADEDYEQFLQEIEGDREMRAEMNLYKAKSKSGSQRASSASTTAAKKNPSDMAVIDDDASSHVEAEIDEEEIRLEELLDDLTLRTSAGEASEGAVNLESVTILSPEAAAVVNQIDIGSSGFDPADYDVSKFKFT